jgi:hypothetical protein
MTNLLARVIQQYGQRSSPSYSHTTTKNPYNPRQRSMSCRGSDQPLHTTTCVGGTDVEGKSCKARPGGERNDRVNLGEGKGTFRLGGTRKSTWSGMEATGVDLLSRALSYMINEIAKSPIFVLYRGVREPAYREKKNIILHRCQPVYRASRIEKQENDEQEKEVSLLRGACNYMVHDMDPQQKHRKSARLQEVRQ